MLALLEGRHISKHYESGILFRKRRCVLDDVSLDLTPGRTVGLMGESGSGKTTLARILAGLQKPSSGSVTFQGKDIRCLRGREWRGFRRSVQMLFQDPEGSLNPMKSIQTSISEVLRLVGEPRAKWPERTSGILETVGLSQDLLCRFPGQISGGQNQRVALARVLLLDPELLILDEPTSALDISVQAQILNLLLELQKKRGLAYLFISHQPEVLRHMSHELFVIENGCLLPYSGKG